MLLFHGAASIAQSPLYENTLKTGVFSNTWDASGQVYILMDDINISSLALGTADSLIVTKIVFGIYRSAGAPAVSVNYYYSVLNESSTNLSTLCSIPVKELGSVDYRNNNASDIVIKETFGDGINPLFSTKINNNVSLNGYHTFFAGISTSKRNIGGIGTGWALTDGTMGNYYDSAWASNRNGNTVGFATADNGSKEQVYYIQVYGYPKGVLPVSITNFTASIKNTTTILNWATASETNNDYFTIERSRNNNDFSAIGTVYSKGNGAAQYSYTDYTPLLGNAYYRLKQTDIDGKFTYSKIVQANISALAHAYISPNPSYVCFLLILT